MTFFLPDFQSLFVEYISEKYVKNGISFSCLILCIVTIKSMEIGYFVINNDNNNKQQNVQYFQEILACSWSN